MKFSHPNKGRCAGEVRCLGEENFIWFGNTDSGAEKEYTEEAAYQCKRAGAFCSRGLVDTAGSRQRQNEVKNIFENESYILPCNDRTQKKEGEITMKKNLKKIFAIVLALTMVFAMSASAFASTDAENETITVTVEFIDENGTVYECTEVSFDTSTFNEHLYSIPANPGTAVITGNTPTVMDATYKALQDLGKSSDMITGWDTEDSRGGMYITKMLGLQTETAADSSSTVWRGYAWEYEIDYAKPDLYATNVALKNGDVISWWYRYCEEPMN